MRMTKEDAENSGGERDNQKPRYGFPMDFECYDSKRPIKTGPQYGVVLGVFAKKKNKDTGQMEPLRSRAGDPMIRVSCGFVGTEGRVQIDYYAPAGSGFYNTFVEHVLPEEHAKVIAAGDKGHDVRDSKAWGRLVYADLVEEEYEEQMRGKIGKFLALPDEAAGWDPDGDGPFAGKQEQQASAGGGYQSPFATAMGLGDAEIPF